MCTIFAAGVEAGQAAKNNEIPPVIFMIKANDIVNSDEFNDEERLWLSSGLVRGYRGLMDADEGIMWLKAFDDCMDNPEKALNEGSQ